MSQRKNGLACMKYDENDRFAPADDIDEKIKQYLDWCSESDDESDKTETASIPQDRFNPLLGTNNLYYEKKRKPKPQYRDLRFNLKRKCTVKNRQNSVFIDKSHLFDTSLSLEARGLLSVFLFCRAAARLRPTPADISKKWRISSSTVSRRIKELKEHHYLNITKSIIPGTNRFKYDYSLTSAQKINYANLLRTDIYHYEDDNLTLESLALLDILLSVRMHWKVTEKGLCEICQVGAKKMSALIKELKDALYLSVSKHSVNKNSFAYIYTLYESPCRQTFDEGIARYRTKRNGG